MNRFLAMIAAASLMSLGAAVQTAGQVSGSANSGAGVQAGQTNTNVNSSTTAGANAGASRSSRQANASGSANNDSSASVDGKSASVNSSSAGSLAAGTTIPATLTKPVDARKARAGDEVAAKTTQDVRSDSGVVIPRGSRLVGHVTDAKAKANGDAESSLGIAFDHAVLRNGQQIPFHAGIRSLAAAENTTSASMGDDNFGSMGGGTAMSAPAVGGGGRGGLLGGAGGTVGGATSTVANTAGSVNNGVERSAANVGANAGGAVSGTTRGAAGNLSSQNEGVVGLKGLSLNSAASSATQGSVITSAGKDVKLDSGTQMLLQVNQQ